jgi:hypothetical protein
MLQIATPPTPCKNDDRNYLARLRRLARRGFRVLKDWSGAWSLVDTRIAPQRALVGLVQVSLATIEVELNHPLPAPRQRSLKATLTRASRIVEAMRTYRAGAMAHHAAQAETEGEAETTKAEIGGVS